MSIEASKYNEIAAKVGKNFFDCMLGSFLIKMLCEKNRLFENHYQHEVCE